MRLMCTPVLDVQAVQADHGELKAMLLPRRAAQEEGNYAHAFWQCVQCGQALGALGALCCAAPLMEGVNALYEETIDRLEAALQAVCADFKPDTLCRVRALWQKLFFFVLILKRGLRVLQRPIFVCKVKLMLIFLR